MRKNRGSVSLISICVSMVLLAIIILFMGLIIYGNIWVMRTGVDKTAATSIANGLLAQYIKYNDFDAFPTIINAVAEEINNTQYIYSIEPIIMDPGSNKIKKINILVKWHVLSGNQNTAGIGVKMVKFSAIEFKREQ